MRYRHVCLEALGYALPEQRVTSDEIERRLGPVYERLGLPAGRLELMTGIRERRWQAAGALPSDLSILSGERALQAANLERRHVGLLVHGSVCRDRLEPATAARVHHALGLPPACLLYDVSNACLGLLNGVVQAADQIELGRAAAALVVGSELGRRLVETTLDALNADPSLTRQSIKPAFASLTIGSASCAILLVHREISQTGNRLLAATARCDTSHHALCQSGGDEAANEAMQPLMATDSEAMLHAGVGLAREAFAAFLEETGWTRAGLGHTVCHQVGSAHRRVLLDALELPAERDFVTYPWLGNTGSAALPITLARGLEEGAIRPGENLALLGIGSGLNCLMLGLHWERTLVLGGGEGGSAER